jgi:hypothetical protein
MHNFLYTWDLMKMERRLDVTAWNVQVLSACYDGGRGRGVVVMPREDSTGDVYVAPHRPLTCTDCQGRGRHAPRRGVLARKFPLPRPPVCDIDSTGDVYVALD